MEHKQASPKNKAKFIHEEKLIREVDYDAITGILGLPKNQPPEVVSESQSKSTNYKPFTKKVIVSIKSRSPAIKTLYIAERNRFHPKQYCAKSGSRLAVGDHSSFTTYLSDHDSNTINTTVSTSHNRINYTNCKFQKGSTRIEHIDTSTTTTKYSKNNIPYRHVPKSNCQRPVTKWYAHPYQQITMPFLKVESEENLRKQSKKIDIGTFVAPSSTEDIERLHSSLIDNIYKKINQLQKKILKREMVFRSINPNISLSSSEDETQEKKLKKSSNSGQPGCSYIEYSHIPDTSAFQRCSHQPAPLSASKATTIQKEHNSEQYGRDFTLYDNVTARGRRQCASVPCKRNEVPKLAAERVHKIRHKLNPVRDYRLMDTVHYLAQGEFAPRDDGIKLTPSREAVLSDIIYEDVCRTHWPNARLGRRIVHPDRCATRSDLQRLIDSLLRERVAHVERRRRRHYRIVKLNHRHENCRPVGKTGDVIVASHKNKSHNVDGEIPLSEQNTMNELKLNRKKSNNNFNRTHSHERLVIPENHQHRRSGQDDCNPGPSRPRHSPTCREPTCCYHTSNPKPANHLVSEKVISRGIHTLEETSCSSITTGKVHSKSPRLVVRKKSSREKYQSNEPNLEHFILLPTLVVRTPSNMRRQKKFNELYHRILNVQMNNEGNRNYPITNVEDRKPEPNKKDIGFNINITLSDTEVNTP